MNWHVGLSGSLAVMLTALLACYMIDMHEKYHEYKAVDQNIVTLPGNTHYCDQFFFGTYFPRMKQNQSGLVRLCQTQLHVGSDGPPIYATLYSTSDRIPVYSAATVQLYPNCSGFSRPPESAWNRVSLALCEANSTDSGDLTLSSRIGHGGTQVKNCGLRQALDSDYFGNQKKIHVDRGHLNPNAINCQDQEGQMGTFTLTNAAPQYSLFNENGWREYECMTEYIIFTYVPTERVHIITGTYGVAKDEHGQPLWMNADIPTRNPVKIPGYYWKAVCYPGNDWEQKKPWGYATIHENVNLDAKSDPANIMKLGQFSSTYFMDDLFESACLNADLGPIENYFGKWNETVKMRCEGQPILTCNH